MCNLYSHTRNVEALRRLFRPDRLSSSAGNFAGQPAIFPGYDGAVVRLQDGQRELTMMHWGFLLPQRGKAPKIVNNTRDDKVNSSSFWKSSFVERRCLIPASSFAEYHPTERDGNGHKRVVWFALAGDEPRPPFAFAGIWRSWKGEYRGEFRELDVYSMLTTTPNELVKPIHPTRMPVILHAENHETWLTASPEAALRLCKPFPAGQMRITSATGKADEPQAV
jgi:putative SOS response-associated peptidase YedK